MSQGLLCFDDLCLPDEGNQAMSLRRLCGQSAEGLVDAFVASKSFSCPLLGRPSYNSCKFSRRSDEIDKMLFRFDVDYGSLYAIQICQYFLDLVIFSLTDTTRGKFDREKVRLKMSCNE